MVNFLAIINMIVIIYIFVSYFKYKKGGKKDKALNDKITTAIGLVVILFIITFIVNIFAGGSSSKNSKPKHVESAKQIKADKEKAKKAKAEAKANAEHKAELKKDKEKQENEDLDQLKNKFNDIPNETHGIIQSVTFNDMIDGEVDVTLSDQALSLNDNQLKDVAKSAADQVSKVVDDYTPLPPKYSGSDIGVKVIDSSGNKIYQSPIF